MKKKLLHHKKKIYQIIIIISVFSVIGGIFGYFLSRGSDAKMQEISQVHEEVIENIQTGSVGGIVLTDTQVASLLQMYSHEKNYTIAASLIQYYLSISDYDAGYDLLTQIKKNNQLDQMYKPTISFLIFNYVISHNNHWKDVVLSDWGIDDDSNAFYTALSFLTKNDFSGFNQSLQQQETTNVVYKNIISVLLKSKQNFTVLKDPPAHYEAGLVAATLMEAGYIPLASLLAKNILATDKKYILSYEILSQAAMKQKRYDEAIKHLQILFSIDTQNISRTAFYLGSAYFRRKDYSNALFYLNQVREEKYLYDAVRYMILSYYNMKSYDKMMDGFRFLLTEQKLTYNDYLLLYDIVFFEPYTKKNTDTQGLSEEYSIKIVIPYIDSCRKNIGSKAPYVCKYGEAGRYLSQGKPDKALKDLLYLTKTYPHPTVFKALGDYYAFKGENEKAQQYFVKSLLSTSDMYQNSGIFSGNSTPK